MKIITIKTIIVSFTVVSFFPLISCNPARQYEKQETKEIQDYLSSNAGLNFELQPSGLYYLEVLAGTGSMPVIGDSAFVKYTGMFLNGSIFETTEGSGKLYPFIVGSIITGFDEGIMLMKSGGKATLLIPSDLAYGGTGSYPIPGYTALLFDVELVRVQPAVTK
ncbi:MAG: FKBP-type peptidyl-prolyl cis-trans isomerase [Bacteroidota bacterium]